MRTPDTDSDRIATRAVETLGRDIFRYVLRRVPSSQDADDVTAAVFLVIWEQRARLPHADQDLRMWCYGIARNKLREHLRSARRRVTRGTTARTDNPAAGLMDPAVVAIQNEDTARVHTALRLLDAKSRELVMLINWDGLSIAEAARLMRMNESTARTRYARARTRLRDLLSSQKTLQAKGGVETSQGTGRHEHRDSTLTRP